MCVCVCARARACVRACVSVLRAEEEEEEVVVVVEEEGLFKANTVNEEDPKRDRATQV